MNSYPPSRRVPTSLPKPGTQARSALERLAKHSHLTPADVADLGKWPAAILNGLHERGLAHRFYRAKYKITEAGKRLLGEVA